jgi:hypothetical protein
VGAEQLHEVKVINGDERRYEEVFDAVLFKPFVIKVLSLPDMHAYRTLILMFWLTPGTREARKCQR